MRRTVPILALALALSALLWGHIGVQASHYGPAALSGAAAPQEQTQTSGDSNPDPNLGFLFGVYIVTWAGFFGYTFMMSRRQREMRREIAALRAVVESRREQEQESF